MEELSLLPSVLILISVAVFVVILFKKLRLSPVLGYLVAGAIIGEHGLGYVNHANTGLLGEFGVVFLLFAIGLELSFERLKAMRKYVLGLGSLQVLLTAVAVGCATLVFGGTSSAAIIVGGGLALSSTAIVMQVIEESGSQSTQTGRISLAILLQQDFIVVPLLVIIPILAGKSDTSILQAVAMSFTKAIVALLCIFIVGRLLLRPLFGLISSDRIKSNELFVASTLLIVLSAAWSTEYLGLSLALGAFVSGVLVAETDFRLHAEESIAPFKGLLLGLFFMSVGMTIDVIEMYEVMDRILMYSFGLICAKTLIIYILCIAFGFSKGVAIHAGLLLSQGGEFAFILFNLAISNGIIDHHIGKILLLVVTCTMALTPLLSVCGQKISAIIDDLNAPSPLKVIANGSTDLANHVIIGGFGRVGKMVSRMLEAEDINYIAIDINSELVHEELNNGFPVFRGDMAQLETLHAAGASRTIAAILTIDNPITVKKSLKIISQNFPDIAIIIRTSNLKSAAELYDAGATIIVPEDYETGLQLGGAVLKAAGIGEHEINRIKAQFRAGNYVMAHYDEDLFDDDDTK